MTCVSRNGLAAAWSISAEIQPTTEAGLGPFDWTGDFPRMSKVERTLRREMRVAPISIGLDRNSHLVMLMAPAHVRWSFSAAVRSYWRRTRSSDFQLIRC
jgi:hypothetical protein